MSGIGGRDEDRGDVNSVMAEGDVYHGALDVYIVVAGGTWLGDNRVRVRHCILKGCASSLRFSSTSINYRFWYNI